MTSLFSPLPFHHTAHITISPRAS
uniref:Uncharacterized protein n=1 Tax=Arundo donax TaxID=35708 RepID=A0A0A8YMA2_ARUDO